MTWFCVFALSIQFSFCSSISKCYCIYFSLCWNLSCNCCVLCSQYSAGVSGSFLLNHGQRWLLSTTWTYWIGPCPCLSLLLTQFGLVLVLITVQGDALVFLLFPSSYCTISLGETPRIRASGVKGIHTLSFNLNVKRFSKSILSIFFSWWKKGIVPRQSSIFGDF